ncbi:uncharacterized protein BDR25DRAFT_229170 [Lindgomyces ingoldianus]|uniref:Uncharacterized protein n=1 Tax=Lindgomyces ingoldianus TaxID=673940 RepID=A0ACB6QR26_9PLEO|nr:uncharacterized protein BDR25DRAFT_229170 [Lindgomyces ingoldianus]KAF2469458.1 hypothetical protein BDR25DRAFT_229170 [Lindgomyces ingoldianus]
MLHSEAASETLARNGDDNITVVMHRGHVFSQIRRFVIVKEMRNFVYACPITTYSGRGTAKPGCDPSEHAIVYFSGSTPQLVREENEKSIELQKEPIGVNPADTSLRMHPASRIRFGKAYPIEWNVKVKDIGDVLPADRTRLWRYYLEGLRPTDD